MKHVLHGRTEDEVLWWQRRSFLHAAAAWTAMGGFASAHAQQRSNVVELQGDAMVNGRPLTKEQPVQTGDSIETGPGSNLIFVIGNSAFQVRQNSRLTVERGTSLFTVSVLRMLTGAVATVWGRGNKRQITTPTLTAGIRGTGTYTEIFDKQNFRSYFCNCYGTIEMAAGPDRLVSTSSYHQSFWGEAEPKNGRILTPANAINHTDEELEYLGKLVNQKTAWEVEGRKGVKNGLGYMDEQPMTMHPANQMK